MMYKVEPSSVEPFNIGLYSNVQVCLDNDGTNFITFISETDCI